MKTLYDDLVTYGESDYYGFHMPGHKRNYKMIAAELPYKIDITEIEGFDDLHHAKGTLLKLQENAARVFGAEETHFLINGSTAGILSAVLGCTQRKDRVLVMRNCHKSVYHAISLHELEAIYLYNGFCEESELNAPLKACMVQKMLEKYEDIRAVIIMSPSYDGVVSDVKEIAEVVHKYGIPLIVDEAHGAHFGFHPYFPKNSNESGADVVIQSIHKTLPSLTQTALLHINGQIVDRAEIRRYLSIVQTSSPSYVLMASMDVCIHLLEEKGQELFENYVNLLKKTRERLKNLACLELIETDRYDRSKFVISAGKTGRTGKWLCRKLLEEYHLQMEMSAGSYVLAMTSIADTKEGMERFVNALCEIDREIKEEYGQCRKEAGGYSKSGGEELRLETVFSAGEMENLVKKEKRRARLERVEKKKIAVMPMEKCAGYVSTEYAYLYPPGVPLLVPGERISQELIAVLQDQERMGFCIEGLKSRGKIEVWTDE